MTPTIAIVLVVLVGLIVLDLVTFFIFDRDEILTWILIRIIFQILLALASAGFGGFGGGSSGGGGASGDWD